MPTSPKIVSPIGERTLRGLTNAHALSDLHFRLTQSGHEYGVASYNGAVPGATQAKGYGGFGILFFGDSHMAQQSVYQSAARAVQRRLRKWAVIEGRGSTRYLYATTPTNVNSHFEDRTVGGPGFIGPQHGLFSCFAGAQTLKQDISHAVSGAAGGSGTTSTTGNGTSKTLSTVSGVEQGQVWTCNGASAVITLISGSVITLASAINTTSGMSWTSAYGDGVLSADGINGRCWYLPANKGGYIYYTWNDNQSAATNNWTNRSLTRFQQITVIYRTGASLSNALRVAIDGTVGTYGSEGTYTTIDCTVGGTGYGKRSSAYGTYGTFDLEAYHKIWMYSNDASNPAYVEGIVGFYEDRNQGIHCYDACEGGRSLNDLSANSITSTISKFCQGDVNNTSGYTGSGGASAGAEASNVYLIVMDFLHNDADAGRWTDAATFRAKLDAVTTAAAAAATNPKILYVIPLKSAPASVPANWDQARAVIYDWAAANSTRVAVWDENIVFGGDDITGKAATLGLSTPTGFTHPLTAGATDDIHLNEVGADWRNEQIARIIWDCGHYWS